MLHIPHYANACRYILLYSILNFILHSTFSFWKKLQAVNNIKMFHVGQTVVVLLSPHVLFLNICIILSLILLHYDPI